MLSAPGLLRAPRLLSLLAVIASRHNRALKTKHETPKYGLIYHASLIGQSAPKYKGKISRVLAAKCSLAIRVDALGDSADASIGIDARAKVRGEAIDQRGGSWRLMGGRVLAWATARRDWPGLVCSAM